MQSLFDSGHAADIILLVLAVEAIWLIGRGHRIAPVLIALAPAALIVLGLRNALTGEPWFAIALPLALAFPVHLLDLRLRRIARSHSL